MEKDYINYKNINEIKEKIKTGEINILELTDDEVILIQELLERKLREEREKQEALESQIRSLRNKMDTYNGESN